MGLISGSGRSLGESNVYLLQYSCLENSMDRGAWWATVQVTESVGTERLTLSFSLFLMDSEKTAVESLGGHRTLESGG